MYSGYGTNNKNSHLINYTPIIDEVALEADDESSEFEDSNINTGVTQGILRMGCVL